MTDKEVRQLNRTQLITLLAEVSGENEELRAEVERLREEIEKLTVTNEKLEYIGSLSRQILEKLSLRENGTARHDYLVGNEEAVSSENTEENTADVPVSDTSRTDPPRDDRDRAVPRGSASGVK